jgi:hypothetical protein
MVAADGDASGVLKPRNDNGTVFGAGWLPGVKPRPGIVRRDPARGSCGAIQPGMSGARARVDTCRHGRYRRPIVKERYFLFPGPV